MNRKQARENTFLLLFEHLCRMDETPQQLYTTATTERELESDDYVRDVFFGTCAHEEEIVATIERNLIGWKAARVGMVTMALCRLGTYEILFREDIPPKVSINEAIELSKKYDDEKNYVFVNGVLNAVAKEREAH